MFPAEVPTPTFLVTVRNNFLILLNQQNNLSINFSFEMVGLMMTLQNNNWKEASNIPCPFFHLAC